MNRIRLFFHRLFRRHEWIGYFLLDKDGKTWIGFVPEGGLGLELLDAVFYVGYECAVCEDPGYPVPA